MATTPTPTPTPSPIAAELSFIGKVSKYLVTHEKLVFTILVILALAWGVSKGLNAWDKHDQRKLDQLQQQLADTKNQVAAQAQQVADAKATVFQQQQVAIQDKAAAAQIISALSAQNAALNKAMSERQQATQKQQAIDLTAEIPILSARFTVLVPDVNPADIKVAPDQQSVTIGKDTAQKTVAQLELVPQLQQDKVALQTEVDNGQKEVVGLQKALDSESKLADTQSKLIDAQTVNITLLNKQLAQGDAVCEEKVKVEHDKVKHAYFRGLKHGVVVGAAATIALLFGVHVI